jgi:hypothetical protein
VGRGRSFGDLRPRLEEEWAQLRLAIELCRTEAFLKDLPSIRENIDAAATTDSSAAIDWDDLPAESRELHRSRPAYYEEVTSTQLAAPHIEEALSRAGMCAVPDEGITTGGINNYFLIALLQHATGNYPSSHAALVDLYSDILSFTPHFEPAADEKISSYDNTTRTLVKLINGDSSIQPKLSVVMISEHRGVVHRGHLEPNASDAHKVVIWDRGGYFEAVTGLVDLSLTSMARDAIDGSAVAAAGDSARS